MEDKDIVSLYWQRNEQAIEESISKYGGYCKAIVGNILENREDCEECLNDTWLRAWESIPPHKPAKLSVFLGRITRNLALDRYKKEHRIRRGGNNTDLIFDELEEIVSGTDDPETLFLQKEIMKEMNKFLKNCSTRNRSLFILRYWYGVGVQDLAKRFKLSEHNVSATLCNMRKKVRKYLAEKGYDNI